MENTSNEVFIENKIVLHNISDNSTDNNFASKENSNSMIDATLNYLNKILLEEETHEMNIVYQDPELLAMEKKFYNILRQEYPPLLDKLSLFGQPRADFTGRCSSLQYQVGSSSANVLVSGINQVEGKERHVLSNTNNMPSNYQANKNLHPFVHKAGSDRVNLRNEENDNIFPKKNGSGGKKKSNDEDLELTEGRNCKISVLDVEEPARNTTFDEVLLYDDFYTKEVASLREIMQVNLHKEKKIQEEVPDIEEKVPDIKDLLIHCSHSIGDNDVKTAEGLITVIRKQCASDGDGNQRLAHVLADALEARLTVTGSKSYNRNLPNHISTTDFLKAHRLWMTASPFCGIAYYFANQTLLKEVGKAQKLHIVDFGINFGFQWPSLIQNMSNKKGGALKLRITGIEFPQPGFRPSKLVDETGRRLKEYAKMFDVPFEYHGIASQWETIQVNDFKFEADEVLVVNSMYRFRQLGDETTGLDCTRDQVLKLILHVRPCIFVYGILNWTLSPFFVTRFRQAMSLQETFFDLLDTLIPRDNKVRQMIERDMLAPSATNIIACEGTYRIERPETYKMWHKRTLRAGFEQIPLDRTIVKKCKETLRKFYDDKRFLVEEENNWFLLGWRGRIPHGLSTWKPKLENA